MADVSVLTTFEFIADSADCLIDLYMSCLGDIDTFKINYYGRIPFRKNLVELGQILQVRYIALISKLLYNLELSQL